MDINTSVVGDVTVLTLAGEIIETDDQNLLRKTVAELLGHCDGRLAIDVGGVTFLCSAAIGTMVVAHKRLDQLGSGLKLSGASERVRHVLAVARLDTLFDVHDTVEAAIAAFQAP